MSVRAGSALWLLRHELRLVLYGLGPGARKGAATRGMTGSTMAVWGALALLMHACAFFVVRELDAGAGAPAVLTGVSAMLAVSLTMMLSTGLRASVAALFERGDLDLLLSSPLSPRSIFMVRLAGVVIAVAGIYLVFLAPFAHAGLVLGKFAWLGIYPTVISLAMVVSSLAMLLTLALVRALGVRRTRLVAQVLGALSGAAVFLLSQWYTGAIPGAHDRAAWLSARLLEHGTLPGSGSPVWIPGRAILGEPMPIVALCVAGVAAFALTVRFTYRFFAQGVQQAAGVAPTARPAGALRFHFGRSLAQVVVIKEWRLIARDTQLMSQVLLQLLYMLPLCFLVFMKAGIALAGIGAALTFLCGSLAGALARIIICAEDAPDLLRAAPCSHATIKRAKIAAVAMPPLALVALPLAWIGLSHPLAAAAMFATALGAVVCAPLIVIRFGRPARRGEFRMRGKGALIGRILEALLGMLWAGLSYLLLLQIISAP